MGGQVAHGHHPVVAQPRAQLRGPYPTAGRHIASALCSSLLIALIAAGCSGTRPRSSLPVDADPGLVHVHGLGINPGMVPYMPQPTRASSSSGTVVPAGSQTATRTPWASP